MLVPQIKAEADVEQVLLMSVSCFCMPVWEENTATAWVSFSPREGAKIKLRLAIGKPFQSLVIEGEAAMLPERHSIRLGGKLDR